MPKIGTKSQKEIFEKLKRYLVQKGYEDFDYNGPNDDSYKFGEEPIRCYVQFISVNAWRRPPESLEVYVRQNERNKSVKEFLSGKGFHGQGDRHVFIIPGDEESYKRALRLIDTI